MYSSKSLHLLIRGIEVKNTPLVSDLGQTRGGILIKGGILKKDQKCFAKGGPFAIFKMCNLQRGDPLRFSIFEICKGGTLCDFRFLVLGICKGNPFCKGGTLCDSQFSRFAKGGPFAIFKKVAFF